VHTSPKSEKIADIKEVLSLGVCMTSLSLVAPLVDPSTKSNTDSTSQHDSISSATTPQTPRALIYQYPCISTHTSYISVSIRAGSIIHLA
jgi:hypothetical protein